MNQRRPLVSVVIPVFNGASYVAKAVESIGSQTFKDWEIIVIDDGSTDGTLDILNELAQTREIKWLGQEHIGQSRAINWGVEIAQGQYVALLDCDDVWLPEKLAFQISVLGNRPDVGLVHSDYEIVNQEGIVLERVRARRSQELIDQAFVGGHSVLPSTTLLRREVMIKAGGWDTALYGSQDIDVSARLYNLTGFECVDKVLVRKLWRRHGHRERFFDQVKHDERVLSSKEIVLRRLEERPTLGRLQRKALDREWGNYYLARGRVANRAGLKDEACRFYWKAIRSDPTRLRSYTRLLRTVLFKTAD